MHGISGDVGSVGAEFQYRRRQITAADRKFVLAAAWIQGRPKVAGAPGAGCAGNDERPGRRDAFLRRVIDVPAALK